MLAFFFWWFVLAYNVTVSKVIAAALSWVRISALTHKLNHCILYVLYHNRSYILCWICSKYRSVVCVYNPTFGKRSRVNVKQCNLIGEEYLCLCDRTIFVLLWTHHMGIFAWLRWLFRPLYTLYTIGEIFANCLGVLFTFWKNIIQRVFLCSVLTNTLQHCFRAGLTLNFIWVNI